MLETNFNLYLNDNYPVYIGIKKYIEMLIPNCSRNKYNFVYIVESLGLP